MTRLDVYSACTNKHVQVLAYLLTKQHVTHTQMLTKSYMVYASGWPEPYIYTVYDRMFGDFSAKKYRIYTVYIWFWQTLYMPTQAPTHDTHTKPIPPP